MLHSKKIKQLYFQAILDGVKSFEIRVNDCDYQPGDYLALNEIYENGEYTGRFTLCKITAMFDLKEYLKDGLIMLSISPLSICSSGEFILYKNNERFRWSKEKIEDRERKEH